MFCAVAYAASVLQAQSAEAEEPPPSFVLNAIEIRDNQVLSEESIARVIDLFLDREINPDDLRDLVARLDALYIQSGYVNSSFLLPDQDVTSGRLILQAQEGSLSGVNYIGFSPSAASRVRRRLDNLDETLNVYELQDTLRLIELDPLFSSVRADLRPGERASGAKLDINLERKRPWDFSAQVDNYRSPSIGAEALSLNFRHHDLTGAEDQLNLGVVGGQGQLSANIDYIRPIFKGQIDLELGYRQGATDVVESVFRDLDIGGDLDSQYLRLRWPFVDQLRRQWSFSIGARRSSSSTELLDQNFSFSLGAEEGESTTFALEADLAFTRQFEGLVLATRLGVRQGIDAFDATIRPATDVDRATGAPLPDGRFTSVIAQVQAARRVDWLDSQLVFSASGQWTSDPLLSVQKIALGGVRSLRGYRENSLVRDRGFDLSVEWRVPVLRRSAGQLTITPFFDFGVAEDVSEELATGRTLNLASAGIGARYRSRRGFDLVLQWGIPFDDEKLPDPSEFDLQDDGLHFAFSWALQ